MAASSPSAFSTTLTDATDQRRFEILVQRRHQVMRTLIRKTQPPTRRGDRAGFAHRLKQVRLAGAERYAIAQGQPRRDRAMRLRRAVFAAAGGGMTGKQSCTPDPAKPIILQKQTPIAVHDQRW